MQESSYTALEEYLNRTVKLSRLREEGVEPYPHSYTPTCSIRDILERGENFAAGWNSHMAEEGATEKVTVAGRIVLLRPMGKNCFAQLQEEGERLQLMFNRDATKIEPPPSEMASMKVIEKLIDLGDIVGVTGHFFRTQRGELTLFVTSLQLLSKALLPLPDKHSGLHNKELRYRKRWLDLLSSQEVMESVRRRSKILRLIRDHLEGEGFIEVETPILQSLYGGADAKPFETKLHALDQQMFLRISLELPLKKLIVGGFNKVFEMGRVFRNEGIDRSHNPEFTMVELYAAYWDYTKLMVFFEKMVEGLALSLFGSTQVTLAHFSEEPVTIDFKAPWKRLSIEEAILEYGNIDVRSIDEAAMRSLLLQKRGGDAALLAPLSRGLLIQELFEEFAEPLLLQPHHICDHPKETTPLCKWHRDPEKRKAGVIERFESYAMGFELCNAYSELNDPLQQRELFQRQREQEGGESLPIDEEFLEAIAQGMPPTGGLGFGVDRLVMLLNDASSIRDVLLFPWMKPLH